MITFKVNGQTVQGEKGQYILGAEAHRGVMQQFLIQALECGAIFEQNVRGVFRLIYNPIIMHVLQQVVEQRVYFSGNGFKNTRKIFSDKIIRKPLGAFTIIDLNKRIFDLRMRNAMLRHLSCKPFMTIDINLNRGWEPGLQTYMHEAKLFVHVVEIQTKATGFGGCKPGSSLPVFKPETMTCLHDGKHTDQPLGNAVAQSDLPCAFFFANRCVYIFKWAVGLKKRLRVLKI